MVNTSKDLGMVAEMPKEIAFHVVLKAVCDRQMLNAVKGRGRGKRPVDKKCPMNSYAALPGMCGCMGGKIWGLAAKGKNKH